MNAAFAAFLLDQLAGLGAGARPMFGGLGLYAENAMFGFVYGDQVYFKVDSRNCADYDAIKAPPLIYAPDKKAQCVESLRAFPAEFLDDADELVAWARKSIAVARAAQGVARPRPKSTATPRRPR